MNELLFAQLNVEFRFICVKISLLLFHFDFC